MTSVILMRQRLIIESEQWSRVSGAMFTVLAMPKTGLSGAYQAVLDIVARDGLVFELPLNQP